MLDWFKENFDLVTFFSIIFLLVMGALSVYSATYDAGASKYFYRQLVWMGIGIVLMLIVMMIPFRTLQLLSYPIYIFSLFGLVAVLIAGKTIAGSTSWFGVKGFGLQPSEVVKATTVLAMASYLSGPKVQLNKFYQIIRASSFAIVPIILILLEPDMGTAVIYVGMVIVILFWAGISTFFIITVTAPGIAALAALYGTTPFLIVVVILLITLLVLRENHFLSAVSFSATVLVGISVQVIFGKLAPHQQKRILIFMNPDMDPLGAGYNVMQSKIAIGSGGLFGKGYLQGTQTQLNFLPAQWTDFIFCVPCEEFGFVGALLIITLLTALLLRGVYIAKTAKNRYASLVAIGVTSCLLVHTVINVGMSMGIFPVVGVPLPFMSYGGSNLLTNLMMGGLLLNMYSNRKEY
ncbi:MAG: rod shape-determining protein RodA [Bacteroidota bacterium]